MSLCQTNTFQFESLRGILRSVRPTHFLGSVIVMVIHPLKVSNVLLIHAIIYVLTIFLEKIMTY